MQSRYRRPSAVRSTRSCAVRAHCARGTDSCFPCAASVSRQRALRARWIKVVSCGRGRSASVSAAHADDRGRMYITPFAGYDHLRIDSGVASRADPSDAAIWRYARISRAVRLGGRGRAIQCDSRGYLRRTRRLPARPDLRRGRLAVNFADGWHLTPRVGRAAGISNPIIACCSMTRVSATTR